MDKTEVPEDAVWSVGFVCGMHPSRSFVSVEGVEPCGKDGCKALKDHPIDLVNGVRAEQFVPTRRLVKK